MDEYKKYRVETNIDYVSYGEIVGNYNRVYDYSFERKAIEKYKDAIWDWQGVINWSIPFNDSCFHHSGFVKIIGIKSNGDTDILRLFEIGE